MWEPNIELAYVHDVVRWKFSAPPHWEARLGDFAGQVPSLHDICAIFDRSATTESIPYLLATLPRFAGGDDAESFQHCANTLERLAQRRLPSQPERLGRAEIARYIHEAKKAMQAKQ
jgi:hypothetical protein